MTEAEWLACAEPKHLHEHVRATLSRRKLLYYTIGCCRRLERFIPIAEVLTPLPIAERFAEGKAVEEELRAALDRTGVVSAGLRAGSMEEAACVCLRYMLQFSAGLVSDRGGFVGKLTFNNAAVTIACGCYPLVALPKPTHPGEEAKLPDDPEWRAAYSAEREFQIHLFRDVAGNPFRPVTLDPAWQTPTVTALARQVYESRDFSAMPILADALQDAGCDDEDVLDHCRGPGPHVRGCWVVDLVLGKS